MNYSKKFEEPNFEDISNTGFERHQVPLEGDSYNHAAYNYESRPYGFNVNLNDSYKNDIGSYANNTHKNHCDAYSDYALNNYEHERQNTNNEPFLYGKDSNRHHSHNQHVTYFYEAYNTRSNNRVYDYQQEINVEPYHGKQIEAPEFNTYGLEDEILSTGINVFDDIPVNGMVRIDEAEKNLTQSVNNPSKLFGLLKSLDLDKDGSITINDFVLFTRKLGIGFIGEPVVKILFKKVDKNRNGKIDFDEVVLLLKVLAKLMMKAKLKKSRPRDVLSF